MELVTNADAAVEFINGIIPTNLGEEAAKITGADLEVVKTKPQVISREDVRKLSTEDMQKLGERVAAGEVVISGE
jgi:carbamoylphosphate synthase large subunit